MDSGFTRIHNQMLENIITSRLSGREVRVLLAIIRFTLGEEPLPCPPNVTLITYFTDGVDKCAVSRIIKKLILRNIILRDSKKRITVNDPDLWLKHDSVEDTKKLAAKTLACLEEMYPDLAEDARVRLGVDKICGQDARSPGTSDMDMQDGQDKAVQVPAASASINDNVATNNAIKPAAAEPVSSPPTEVAENADVVKNVLFDENDNFSRHTFILTETPAQEHSHSIFISDNPNGNTADFRQAGCLTNKVNLSIQVGQASSLSIRPETQNTQVQLEIKCKHIGDMAGISFTIPDRIPGNSTIADFNITKRTGSECKLVFYLQAA